MTPFLWGLIVGLFAGAAVGWIGLSLVACGGRADLEAENARLMKICIEQGNALEDLLHRMVKAEEHNAKTITPSA